MELQVPNLIIGAGINLQIKGTNKSTAAKLIQVFAEILKITLNLLLPEI